MPLAFDAVSPQRFRWGFSDILMAILFESGIETLRIFYRSPMKYYTKKSVNNEK